MEKVIEREKKQMDTMDMSMNNEIGLGEGDEVDAEFNDEVDAPIAYDNQMDVDTGTEATNGNIDQADGNNNNSNNNGNGMVPQLVLIPPVSKVMPMMIREKG